MRGDMACLLVIDDDAAVRNVIRSFLEGSGHSIIEAEDGRSGLIEFRRETVDLVITDLNMPGLDGIELIRQVRTLPAYKYVPIVMLTTESTDGKKQAGRAAGATGWIVKPFRGEQLVAVAKKLVS